MLRIFGVPLAMVRVVGGIILMKIGFELFYAITFERWTKSPDTRPQM